MKEFLAIAEQNQRRAHEIIEETGIVPLWQSIGAKVNLVGSLKMELLMKHRDIDFHIYTDELNLAASFSVIARLAENPAITRIEYANGMATEEECIEWHAWYKDADAKLWQLDMIHIHRGSRYDGYFEQVAEQISRRLTQKQRETILQLKYETPDDEVVQGVEYYRAVLEFGVNSYADFIAWREKHPIHGVLEWMP